MSVGPLRVWSRRACLLKRLALKRSQVVYVRKVEKMT